jgi:hypothetical protein
MLRSFNRVPPGSQLGGGILDYRRPVYPISSIHVYQAQSAYVLLGIYSLNH